MKQLAMYGRTKYLDPSLHVMNAGLALQDL